MPIIKSLSALLLSLMLPLCQPAQAKTLCRTPDPATVEYLQRLTDSVAGFRLDNGLRVFLLPDPHRSTVTTRLVFRVGARDEAPFEYGYAHLFEHLMFKGSREVPGEGHFRLIEQVGGETNAITTFDQTDYWNRLPAGQLDLALRLEAARWQGLQLGAEKIRNQLAAVREERALRLDNQPYAKVLVDLFLKLAAGTPYGHNPLGTDAALDGATAERLQNFFERHYRPDNGLLIITGKFTPATARTLVARQFGALRAVAEPAPEATAIYRLDSTEARLPDPLAPFPLYGMAWTSGGQSARDYRAVEITGDLLFGNASSRFQAQLRKLDKPAFLTQSFTFGAHYLGITAIGFVPRGRTSFREFRELVDNTIREAQVGGITRAEVCRAIRSRQTRYLQELATSTGVARLLGNQVLLGHAPDFLQPWQAWAAQTPASVEKVIGSHFRQPTVAVEVAPNRGLRFVKKLLELMPENMANRLEDAVL